MKEKGQEACDMAFISHRRVQQCDGSLRRCKAISVCSAITGCGRQDEWGQQSAGRAADSGPHSVPRAQPAPPNAIWPGAFRGVASGDAHRSSMQRSDEK
jgi:hypothetical protein